MTDAESFWQPDAVRTAAGGGRWLHRPVDPTSPAAPLSGLSTDSRSVSPGQVFLALRGEHFDGHDFLTEALARGAGMLIVQSPPTDLAAPAPGLHVLLVDDTVKALTRLATAYRRSLKTTHFIAVTGSSGKTTTKQMLLAVLGQRFRVSASRKSFNNHIGVPLTVLGAISRDQYVICEVGTNHPGEIAALTSIIEPDIGIITSVGRVHLEGLGSIEGVANEKAALLAGLAPGGWAAVCIDEPAICPHVERVARGITFGFTAQADLRINECTVDDDGTSFSLGDRSRWHIALHGRHHASNACAAIAVGRRCGIDDAHIQAGLHLIEPPEMRFVRQQLGTVTLFDDSYNANPDSMAASIDTFRQLGPAPARRVAILGDMLELGSHSQLAHLAIAGQLAAQAGQDERLIDVVAFVGPEMKAAADEMRMACADRLVEHFGTLHHDDVDSIVSLVHEGDCVLIKGSRGMRLERVAQALRDRFLPTTAAIPARRATNAP